MPPWNAPQATQAEVEAAQATADAAVLAAAAAQSTANAALTKPTVSTRTIAVTVVNSPVTLAALTTDETIVYVTSTDDANRLTLPTITSANNKQYIKICLSASLGGGLLVDGGTFHPAGDNLLTLASGTSAEVEVVDGDTNQWCAVGGVTSVDA